MAYDSTSIVVVGILLPLIALVAVCLRFWVRLRFHPTYIGIDDWLILGAIIFSMADGANLCVTAILGIQGRDYPGELPPDREMIERKSDYAQVILEKPLYALMKLSVLFFYRRIFDFQTHFRPWNNVLICLITVWGIAFMLAEIFMCGDKPSAIWDPTVESANCVNQTWLNFWFAITDAVGDILVCIMPYPYIRRLQMSRRERAGVAFIFMLGLLSTAASIARLGFISVAFTQDFGSEGNTHGSGTPPAVWSTVEGAVGVLAACLPPLAPLIKKSPSPRKAYQSLRSRFAHREGHASHSNHSGEVPLSLKLPDMAHSTEPTGSELSRNSNDAPAGLV